MKEGMKIVFIIALAIGLLWSCNKTLDETSIISENELEQLSENELLIRSFLNRMNNTEKTSGEYTVDSAVWYIESTLNYTYSIWDSAFKHQKFDTSFISISLNQNDNIDDSDVSTAYDKLEDSLGVHWDNTPGSTKHVIATDINVKSNSSGTVVIRLISAIGGGSAPGPYGSFGDDDHWIWGWDEGGCGPNPATSSDASDELVYKYMNPIVTVSNVNRIYFTDVEIHEYVVPGDYVDQNSPCGYTF